MIRTNHIGIAMLLSALLVSNISSAASCNERSPNLILLGDKYYDLDVVPLTPKDRKVIISIAKKMVGHWKGEGTRFQCTGSDEDPGVENRTISLTANIAINSSGALQINTEKYIKEERVRFQDTLMLFSNLAEQTAAIVPDGFEVIEKFRPKTNEKYRPLIEIIHRITYSRQNLIYTLSVYANGYLAEQEHWKLIRN
ncbi:MAG: hypothetical protein L3J26_03870 [Candidatus Polarisedimenticolaceae bacterium]|nr:hypothetical protein [Candidatus Polarisedimenticolaceae bacterium]